MATAKLELSDPLASYNTHMLKPQCCPLPPGLPLVAVIMTTTATRRPDVVPTLWRPLHAPLHAGRCGSERCGLRATLSLRHQLVLAARMAISWRPWLASACFWPGGGAEARNHALSALLPVSGTRDAVAAVADASGVEWCTSCSISCMVHTVCDPCKCMNISCRVECSLFLLP